MKLFRLIFLPVVAVSVIGCSDGSNSPGNEANEPVSIIVSPDSESGANGGTTDQSQTGPDGETGSGDSQIDPAEDDTPTPGSGDADNTGADSDANADSSVDPGPNNNGEGSDTTTDTPQNDDTDNGTNTDATAPENETDIPSPVAPENLNGIAYTDTEIEIFWDRSSDTTVTGYRVSRDGIEQMVVDALSYYDNTIAPGSTVYLSVQSVDADGNTGEPVSIFLTTPQAMPTINASNVDQIIGYIADIANGGLFGGVIEAISTVDDIVTNNVAPDNGFIETDGYRSESGEQYIYEFDCEFAGTFTSGRTFNALPSASGEFTDCETALFPGSTINGNFSNGRQLSKNVFNSGISNDIDIDNLNITDSNGKSQTLTGRYYRFGGDGKTWAYTETRTGLVDENNVFIRGEDGNIVVDVEPLFYRSPAFEGETRIFVTNITIRQGTFGARVSVENDFVDEFSFKHDLSAEFTVQAPETGNKQITITTPVVFERTDTDFFSVGQMVLSAEDGSSVMIDANTSDATTVRISITAEGITTNDIRAWTQPESRLLSIPND